MRAALFRRILKTFSSFLILDTLSLQCNVFLFIFLFYLFNVFEINSEMLRSFLFIKFWDIIHA